MKERPTPETDGSKLNHSFGVVDIEFARRLERERDAARERLDEALNQLLKLRESYDEAWEKLQNLQVRGVHSCSQYCTRPMCVLRRERDEANAELELWREGKIIAEKTREKIVLLEETLYEKKQELERVTIRDLKSFAVIAYRWGEINNHSYIVDTCILFDEAVRIANAEAMDRGGKYGVTVYRGTEVVHHAKSMANEEGPWKNTELDIEFAKFQTGAGPDEGGIGKTGAGCSSKRFKINVDPQSDYQINSEK